MESQLGKPPTLCITTKLYLQIVCKHQLVGCTNTQVFYATTKGCTNTLFTRNNWKEAMTPYKLAACPCASLPHPYMIIRSLTSVHI